MTEPNGRLLGEKEIKSAASLAKVEQIDEEGIVWARVSEKICELQDTRTAKLVARELFKEINERSYVKSRKGPFAQRIIPEEVYQTLKERWLK